jgi:glutamate-5-semialdehyde dehydrogenase
LKEAKQAQQAKLDFIKVSEQDRIKAILEIAKALDANKQELIQANQHDILAAKQDQLSKAMIDRLEMNESRINALIDSVKAIANQEQVVGEITQTMTRPDGLIIQKQRIPLGVIGMIFESRPNVVIDCSCLAIKSGNCIILKGGKEAKHSNLYLAKLVQQAISKYIPKLVVQLIESRQNVSQLLDQVGLVDVIIPRGGEKLIEYVYKNSKIPVIAHFKGLCHIYIDADANLEHAINIVINAKTQRPGVCNAVETLLLHKDLPIEFVDQLFNALIAKETELRVCDNTNTSLKNLKSATEDDWETEYLDNILSVKTISNLDEAIKHIQIFGSHHTEAIISNTKDHLEKFQNQVDASSIMLNASTRFNDGGEYNLGAELGISTTKLHAYGPMGAKEMTTERYVVVGDGHIRGA